MDNVDDLLDFFSLRKIHRTICRRINHLENPPFWMTPAEKLRDFRYLLFYESLREKVWETIDEICHTPIYNDSNYNFDGYGSFDEE